MVTLRNKRKLTTKYEPAPKKRRVDSDDEEFDIDEEDEEELAESDEDYSEDSEEDSDSEASDEDYDKTKEPEDEEKEEAEIVDVPAKTTSSEALPRRPKTGWGIDLYDDEGDAFEVIEEWESYLNNLFCGHKLIDDEEVFEVVGVYYKEDLDTSLEDKGYYEERLASYLHCNCLIILPLTGFYLLTIIQTGKSAGMPN
jgi:hypothetical protein